MFEKSDVAGQKGRSGEANYLPEREVPGHHRENWPDGKIADKTFLGSGFDDFVGKKALGVVGIVAATSGTLYRFGDRCLERLAHFEGREGSELIFVALEDVSCLAHAARTFGERHLALGVVCSDGELQLLLNLGIRERIKSFNNFAGSGINACNSHEMFHLELETSKLHDNGASVSGSGQSGKRNRRSYHYTIDWQALING